MEQTPMRSAEAVLKRRRGMMISRLQVLFGISVFWLALSLLFDGLTALVLPRYLLGQADQSRATTLGLLTFVGLLAGMLVQPVAGAWSDRRGHAGGGAAPSRSASG